MNTIVFEFLASGISKCLNRSPPRFDISANSVDIIFGSAISLVGYYFTPLLCALSCLRLAVMFYVKWLSVSMVCDVPKFVLNLGSVSVTQIIGQSISYFFSLLFLVTFILPTPTSDNCGPFGMVQNLKNHSLCQDLTKIRGRGYFVRCSGSSITNKPEIQKSKLLI